MKSSFPNFIVIGAMKAGSSSLWHYLRAHPEIYMPDLKEPDIFVKEKNWSRGWSWYQDLFNEPRALHVRMVGEASTSYSKHSRFEGVPQRIVGLIPDVRLIYLVRDPIERIRSMYVHMVYRGYETRPFDQVMAVLEANHYLDLSLYFYQLRQYLAHFSDDQILVLGSEDLRDDRQLTLKQAFRFLGVTDTFTSDAFLDYRNRSAQKRRPTRVGSAVQHFPYIEEGLWHFPAGVQNLWQRLTTVPIRKPEVNKDLQARLVERLGPDVEALRRWTGQSFASWSI